VPKQIAEGLWTLEHDFAMPGGIEIGTRTSVVRLQDGGLWLHAPGNLDDTQVDWLRGQGPVRAIVAPNLFHHLFLRAAVANFPGARLFAPHALADKCPGLRFERLCDAPPVLWEGALEQVRVDGAPRLAEFAFLHVASRTLLLTDLCFNVHRARNLRTRLALGALGAWKRFGPSRLGRSLMRERGRVRRSVDRILAWDFDRAIVSHGDIVEEGAHESLRQAFAWLK